MNSTDIKAMQRTVGVEPDGFWGRLSQAALETHLKSLRPSPHPFPMPDQKSVTDFYGPHGLEDGYTPPTKLINLPFQLWLYGDRRKPVDELRPHVKCADSLLAVFNRLHEALPTKAEKVASGILVYDGLYNPRRMRGGTNWSMHSWAIAIDLNASANGNTTHWPTAALMPLVVMECFAAEGWMPAGAFWNRDAMHFQATR